MISRILQNHSILVSVNYSNYAEICRNWVELCKRVKLDFIEENDQSLRLALNVEVSIHPSVRRIAQQGGWRKFIWDVWNIISVWKGEILWECESANAMMQCRGQLYPAHIPLLYPLPSSLLSSRYLISLIDLIGCSAGCAALPLYLPFPSHFQTYLLSHLSASLPLLI